MTVSDDHREEDRLHPWEVVSHLVRHVLQGAVDVGAFAQVSYPAEAPDEALLGGELAEDHLRLGEVQAPYGPGEVDLGPVILISQPLGEDPGELLDVLHQYTRWRLLEGNGLRGVDGEEQLDGTVDDPDLTTFRSLDWTVTCSWDRPRPSRRQSLRDGSVEHGQEDQV